jgi:hypothetical protein
MLDRSVENHRLGWMLVSPGQTAPGLPGPFFRAFFRMAFLAEFQ